MEEEKLCQRSQESGAYAMERLRAIQKHTPLIGDVRGLGLMIGIELVKDTALAPAAAEAEAVRDFCLRNGVLIGVGGVFGNVVRMQPPLVISRQQLDKALDVLEQALAEASGKKVRAAS